MSAKTMKITPEVRMDDKVLFLIRVNGEEMAFADTSKEALLIVDSVAAAEQKRLENEWTKVYREDLKNGQKVVISTQELGYLSNGFVYKSSVIDYIPVGHSFLVKGRHELELTETVEDHLNVLIPDILQMLAKENVKEDSDSDVEEEPESLEEES